MVPLAPAIYISGCSVRSPVSRPPQILISLSGSINRNREIVCSISSGGSSISDFVDSAGRKGYFQLELMVYGRAGEKCLRCGSIIARQLIAGRSTFFCPVCQK